MPSFFRTAEVLMVQYARYHRDRRNIATHFVGIPLIFLAIGVWLASPVWTVAGWDLTPAWLMWGLSSVWYLGRGQWLLGLATCLVNGLLIALAHQLLSWPLPWGWGSGLLGAALFVVGWLFQFIGHHYEGRKPAFVDDIVGLLVGPMFVVGEALMALGLLGSLHRAIERQAGPVR
jgi:uncharacterized membrane protein YGL010W